jgi:predicted metal-dependent phosphoesterase TrpH
VQYAALTDHETLEGLLSFRQTLQSRGTVAITGIELFAHVGDMEVHLLGYGIDPYNLELKAYLSEKRASRDPNSHAFSPNRRFPAMEVIALIRRSGGIAVLAHPFATEPDVENLRTLQLQREGYGQQS